MKKVVFIFILFLYIIYVYYNTDLIKTVSFDDDVIYLYVGEKSTIDYNISFYKHKVNNYYFQSNNDNVVEIKDNKIIGKNVGETEIKFKYNNEVYTKTKVIVSNLYNEYKINNNKDSLGCNIYTESENDLLDKILKYKINKAGYKTRAGVVEAARFLTLSFPYKINYFYENGRLNNHNGNRKYVDGEGRYYREGLYLNEIRTSKIIFSYKGPVPWGCNLYSFITKTTLLNGLDCSGFVSWTILNGGFDVGDSGAGDTEFNDDLSDLGYKNMIKENDFSTVKVGDLIGRDGHIGIIIGIDKSKYYIAESLDNDLHVLNESLDEIKYNWEYIIQMDSVYLKDGNITNMW